MGIADIFEALTARDRPYKKGKTLSESLEILGRMKLNNHIDPDLFDIFVRKKVYRRYAEMFLDRSRSTRSTSRGSRATRHRLANENILAREAVHCAPSLEATIPP